MAFIAIFAAINYIVFSYLKIDIPLAAGSSVAIHVANAIVVVSAFLLGPAEGGVAGAIGLSIADLLDPRYVASAPKTFFLKFCIGYLSGKVGQKLGLAQAADSRQAAQIAAISAAAGLGFNVVFDPIIGYLFKRFILGINAEAAAIILTWTGRCYRLQRRDLRLCFRILVYGVKKTVRQYLRAEGELRQNASGRKRKQVLSNKKEKPPQEQASVMRAESRIPFGGFFVDPRDFRLPDSIPPG